MQVRARYLPRQLRLAAHNRHWPAIANDGPYELQREILATRAGGNPAPPVTVVAPGAAPRDEDLFRAVRSAGTARRMQAPRGRLALRDIPTQPGAVPATSRYQWGIRGKEDRRGCLVGVSSARQWDLERLKGTAVGAMPPTQTSSGVRVTRSRFRSDRTNSADTVLGIWVRFEFRSVALVSSSAHAARCRSWRRSHGEGMSDRVSGQNEPARQRWHSRL
jgi:hypothetical protein